MRWRPARSITPRTPRPPRSRSRTRRPGEGGTLDFVVALEPAATGTVTVDYATADGTATAGADYTAASGTLTFQAGETEKTIAVPVTDDDAEDEGETFTLTLSNASGAEIADAEATGTIRNAEAQQESGQNTPAAGLSHHQRNGAGGRDADGRCVGHRRRRRADQRVIQLPVDRQRRYDQHRHPGRHGLDLHTVGRRRRQDHQGPRVLHRRRRQCRISHQHSNRAGGRHGAHGAVALDRVRGEPDQGTGCVLARPFLRRWFSHHRVPGAVEGGCR